MLNAPVTGVRLAGVAYATKAIPFPIASAVQVHRYRD
jgi:hypothetical protein